MSKETLEHMIECLERAELNLLAGDFEFALEQIETLLSELEVDEPELN